MMGYRWRPSGGGVEVGDSQLDHDRPGFDLVHLHEGKTFCAGEPLFGFVVLEFEEDSCSWGGV